MALKLIKVTLVCVYEQLMVQRACVLDQTQSLSEGDAGTGVDEGRDAVSWSGTCSRAARFVLRASFSLSMPSTCS